MAKRQSTISTKPVLPRPPVVTIMGHVDHGKTSLLDYIRQSHITESEHGGITQHIGAYQVTVNNQAITFIDTPGHAAFAKMRARGAQVTDVIILVVAANDGVKPQTIESIQHIKAAAVPFIVAINKIDLDSANPDTVKSQLAEQEVFCEGYGGQVPSVNISAKTGQGIQDLLDMVILVSEVSGLTSEPDGPLKAVVIESNLDPHRGTIATVIVRSGTLTVNSTVFIEDKAIRLRQLLNDRSTPISQAYPGEPAVILGFKKILPPVGSVITHEPVNPVIIPSTVRTLKSSTAESLPPTEGQEAEPPEVTEVKPHFNLLLKADMAGTLEAITNNLTQDEITLVGSGIGPINDSDILLAVDTQAIVLGFNIPVTAEAARLADREGVKIKTFSIIYELLEYLEDKVLELLEPTIFEQDIGTAQVGSVFNIRGDVIAGCLVKTGKLTRGEQVHVVRRDRVRHTGKISSLKQGKESVKVVKAGIECGLVIDPPFDFRIGDMIKSYKIVKK